MELLDKYLAYWPIFAGSLLFLLLALWWRRSASRAMELAPKHPEWVKNYRAGGFPFDRTLPDRPRLCVWALLLALLAGAAAAAGRLANTSMIFLGRPELFLRSRYGIALPLLRALGAGGVYCLLTLLFGSTWVALPGALLFAASASGGQGEGSFLALIALFLLLYLRAKKAGFPAELLYLAAVLLFGPMLALRQALIWLALCLPLLHWYKLAARRRAGLLSGGKLMLFLLLALLGWALALLLAAALRRYLMYGFRTRELLAVCSDPQRLRLACEELLSAIREGLWARPGLGITIHLMIDAPLLGMGLWGCCSAWVLARQRRDVRGVLVLTVLGVLVLVWLVTSRYVLTLGLVLAAACTLRDADLGKKRAGTVLLTLAGICWYVCLQLAAWYVPLTAGLVERLV